MTDHEVTFDEVFSLAQRLHPPDQARLIARLAPTLEHLLDLKEATPAAPGRPRLRGLLTDLGPAPSAEDIDGIQREMWAHFPGEAA